MNLRNLAVVMILVIVLAVAGCFVFVTTPFFAFVDAALAVQERSVERFQKRVDIHGLVENLLNDLLMQPAQSTPGLDTFQREVGLGAIGIAKESMQNELERTIVRFVANGVPGRQVGYLNCGPDAACAAPVWQVAQLDDFRQLINVASHELGGQAGKMKREAYARMVIYARSHRNTLPGRLLSCPPEQRGQEARRIVEEYGLTAQNFRGISSYAGSTNSSGGDVAHIGLGFFSPKVNHEVRVEVEVIRPSAFSDWKISRLSNLQDVFVQLQETYIDDVHALVAYSLAGMSNKNVQHDLRGMTERLKQTDAAKNLMRRFNFR